jgi:hypothetical protein
MEKMKNGLWVFLVLAWIPTLSFAAKDSTSAFQPGNNPIEIGTAFCFVLDNTGLGTTGGGIFDGYYFVSPQVGIGCEAGIYNSFYYSTYIHNRTVIAGSPQTIVDEWQTNGNYLTRTELLGSVKIRLGDRNFDPYITTGVGILFTSDSVTMDTTYNATPFWGTPPPQYQNSITTAAPSIPSYPIFRMGFRRQMDQHPSQWVVERVYPP